MRVGGGDSTHFAETCVSGSAPCRRDVLKGQLPEWGLSSGAGELLVASAERAALVPDCYLSLLPPSFLLVAPGIPYASKRSVWISCGLWF